MEEAHSKRHSLSPFWRSPTSTPEKENSSIYSHVHNTEVVTVKEKNNCGHTVEIKLQNNHVWSQFRKEGTEMILTRSGRRMFPTFAVTITGLNAMKRYKIYVTLKQLSHHSYKYCKGEWVENAGAETYPPKGVVNGLRYDHPDGSNFGRHWMRHEVNFLKLKLSNKVEVLEKKDNSVIFCYSLHKYLPVLNIVETDDRGMELSDGFFLAVTFPVTEFVTVTAYQNPDLSMLKIQYNPYAKGVRNQCERSSTGVAVDYSGYKSGTSVYSEPVIQHHLQPEHQNKLTTPIMYNQPFQQPYQDPVLSTSTPVMDAATAASWFAYNQYYSYYNPYMLGASPAFTGYNQSYPTYTQLAPFKLEHPSNSSHSSGGSSLQTTFSSPDLKHATL